MRSTLYLKFIILYVIFGFLSLFTAATLTSGLVEQPLRRYIASRIYQEASLVANDYLPQYFSERLSLNDVHLQLTGMETQLGASVWFLSQDGEVLTSARSEGYPEAPDMWRISIPRKAEAPATRSAPTTRILKRT